MEGGQEWDEEVQGAMIFELFFMITIMAIPLIGLAFMYLAPAGVLVVMVWKAFPSGRGDSTQAPAWVKRIVRPDYTMGVLGSIILLLAGCSNTPTQQELTGPRVDLEITCMPGDTMVCTSAFYTRFGCVSWRACE